MAGGRLWYGDGPAAMIIGIVKPCGELDYF